jgi:hypothetical protein
VCPSSNAKCGRTWDNGISLQRREREEAERSRLKQLTERAEAYNSIREKLIDLATKVENSDGKIEIETKSLAGKY